MNPLVVATKVARKRACGRMSIRRSWSSTLAHIPDGVLTAPVLIAGTLASAGLVAVALRRLDYDRLPQAAVLAAGFFVSSLIQVPFGVTSVHLLLNGLMGLLLGWTAVPALLVALTLQTVFFGYGGALVLGALVLGVRRLGFGRGHGTGVNGRASVDFAGRRSRCPARGGLGQ